MCNSCEVTLGVTWTHLIYIYIYIRLNEMSKNGFLKFYIFISYVISIITWEHLLLVMNENMVFIIRVWLVLSLNVLVWLCLIVDY